MTPFQRLKFKRLHPDAKLPTWGTDGAACFDLYAATVEGGSERRPLYDTLLIDTGLAVEIPPGWAMLIYSRSGHGFKSLVRLANCVGVIDSDYRGSIAVRLVRDSDDEWTPMFGPGDRIAQALLTPVYRPEFIEVEELSSTARGEGGFGSTGA